MIPLPRVYVNGKFNRILHPVSVTLTQNIIPLDSASIVLANGEFLEPQSYVELFTAYGSAGMFRVRNPKNAYGMDTSTAELEHMISEVGDYLVKEELSEMMEADKAFGRVFNHYHGGLWQIGSASALGKDKIALEAKYDRVLDVLLSILEQKPDCMMTFDFTKNPWRVSVVKKPTSVTAEGRLSRNVSSATISYDDTELVTRVWYQTYNKKKEATWKYKNSGTQNKYGIVEGKINTSSDMTDEEITSTVDTYLAEHKEPRVSVNIQADELSQITGAGLDKFTIGKLMRLNLVDYGVTVEKTITSIIWNDVYGSRSVTVNLGDEEDTVVTFLHNMESTGSGGGGGSGKAKDDQEEQWSAYKVQWEKLGDSVAGMVALQDETGKILEQAGLTLNSKGVLIYAKNAPNGLYHQFDILSDSFTSKITNTKEKLESKIEQTAERITLAVKRVGKVESRLDVAEDNITMTVRRVDGAESRLSVAEDDITAEVQRATSAEGTLSGRITVQADKVSLVVEEKDGQNVVKAASIVAGINAQSGSFVKIQANKINLDGYVTTSMLESAFTSAQQMATQQMTISQYFTCLNYNVEWKTATLRTPTLSTKRNFMYGSTSSTSGTVNGYVITDYTDTTLYYLGR